MGWRSLLVLLVACGGSGDDDGGGGNVMQFVGAVELARLPQD